jgi:methenyltetrahydrofolate cyclohydrolase
MNTELQILHSILDSNDMGVGGGSSSALAGSMAAALVAMVAKLSINKNCSLHDEEYKKIAEEADLLKNLLLQGAQDDAEAYSLIKNAYQLPRATEEEKLKRDENMSQANIEATRVPYKNAKLASQVQELCALLVNNSNPNASSDLNVAELLAFASLMGCLANMQINIDSIKSASESQKFKEELEHLRSTCKIPTP